MPRCLDSMRAGSGWGGVFGERACLPMLCCSSLRCSAARALAGCCMEPNPVVRAEPSAQVVLPAEMTVAESHDIALALQHKARAGGLCLQRAAGSLRGWWASRCFPGDALLLVQLPAASMRLGATATFLIPCSWRPWTMWSAPLCTWITRLATCQSTRWPQLAGWQSAAPSEQLPAGLTLLASGDALFASWRAYGIAVTSGCHHHRPTSLPPLNAGRASPATQAPRGGGGAAWRPLAARPGRCVTLCHVPPLVCAHFSLRRLFGLSLLFSPSTFALLTPVSTPKQNSKSIYHEAHSLRSIDICKHVAANGLRSSRYPYSPRQRVSALQLALEKGCTLEEMEGRYRGEDTNKPR